MSDLDAVDALFASEADEVESAEKDLLDNVASLADVPVMAFVIKNYVIRALLEKAVTVVPSKDIMPLLKNFEMRVSAHGLRVVATDMELSVVCTTKLINNPIKGVAVLPAAKLLSIVRQSEEADVHLSVKGNTATIEIGKASWEVRLQPAADYPELPDASTVELHPTDRKKFLGAISAVKYAAAKETNRARMMALNVEGSTITACDGVRFQQAGLGADFPIPMQIPIGAVDDLVKLMNTTEADEIRVGESESHLVFGIGTDLFLVNRMMSVYPDLRETLLRPALANDAHFSVGRGDLLSAVRRVRINADPETSAIGLYLEKDSVTVRSKDKFGNAATEVLSAGWGHAPRLLVVNHQFLVDLLVAFPFPVCSFFLGADTKSRKSPILLKSESLLGTVQQMAAHWLGYEK